MTALREEIAFLRKQFHFYQGKCERLELAMMESRAGAPSNYVDRTERRRPIEETPITGGKLTFRQIKEAWGKLSPEEQDKHLAAGDWEVEPKEKAN